MLENLKNKAKNHGLTSTNLTIIGVSMLATGAYLMHRGRLNSVIEMSQASVQDTTWASFNEGVRYGLQLAKDVSEGEVFAFLDNKEALKNASQYAFKAFDK